MLKYTVVPTEVKITTKEVNTLSRFIETEKENIQKEQIVAPAPSPPARENLHTPSVVHGIGSSSVPDLSHIKSDTDLLDIYLTPNISEVNVTTIDQKEQIKREKVALRRALPIQLRSSRLFLSQDIEDIEKKLKALI